MLNALSRFKAAALALGLAVAASMACAQDIKIGFNGDQSASGAAELGVAGRWGFEAAIEDLNKAGGVLGRKVVGLIRDDTGAAAQVDPEHERTDRQRKSRCRHRADQFGQRASLAAYPSAEESARHRTGRHRHGDHDRVMPRKRRTICFASPWSIANRADSSSPTR